MVRKKMLIISDLEGVAGVTSFADVAPSGRYYERSKYLLTGEINAAVEGILQATEAEIFVIDGHRWGGINYEELHQNVKYVAGERIFRNFSFQHFAALFFVGQHARNGVERAHLGHTLDRDAIIAVSVNGIPVGEFGIWAGYAGNWEVPTIFLSGDTAACEEASELVLNISTVAVKEGLDREAAIHLTHQKAIERIRKGAEDAVKNLANVKPLHFAPAFEVLIEFTDTGKAKQMAFEKQGKLVSSRKVSFSFEEYSDVVRLWM